MPPKPKEPQFERSKYRLKTFGRNTAKKGEVTEAALGEALEEFGKVWQVLADPAKDNAFVVTFKSTAAVDAALQRERITVGGRTEVKLVALPLANPSLEKKEQFFLEFFSKTSQKPSSMAVTDTFDSSKVYPPGSDVHFSVQLTNKATQPRELQGVLMPYQTHKMFTLSGTEGKGAAKFPIKLPPGGSHTQAVKFTSRPHQQGIFKHTMLFNFSNWVRAILARTSGAQFGAEFSLRNRRAIPLTLRSLSARRRCTSTCSPSTSPRRARPKPTSSSSGRRRRSCHALSRRKRRARTRR